MISRDKISVKKNTSQPYFGPSRQDRGTENELPPVLFDVDVEEMRHNLLYTSLLYPMVTIVYHKFLRSLIVTR